MSVITALNLRRCICAVVFTLLHLLRWIYFAVSTPLDLPLWPWGRQQAVGPTESRSHDRDKFVTPATLRSAVATLFLGSIRPPGSDGALLVLTATFWF